MLSWLLGVKLGPPGHEYATTWRVNIPFTTLNLRLHHWYGSDDTRAYHSHPQWFWTLVLWGAYRDISPVVGSGAVRVDLLGWLSFRRRAADYRHYVQPTRRHTWTLLLFGGSRQRWDFYEKNTGKRYRRDKWFAEYGHHTQDGSPPVRMRPDGSLIGGEQ